MTDEPVRVIVLKNEIHELAPDEQGQPVEDVMGDHLPAMLKGAKIYTLPNGRRVVARPGFGIGRGDQP
jgi:hypothetical protein